MQETGPKLPYDLDETDAKFVQHFMRMVQIDSESGDEKEFIEYLSQAFSNDLGGEAELDGYGNLIVRIPAKASDKTTPVLLCGHADTVKPSRGVRPSLSDGIIRSDGTTVLGADNKAGLAEIFEAIRVAPRRPPLEILVTRQEEVGFLGAKNIDFARLKSRIGYVVDIQALDKVLTGSPSIYFIDITIEGKAAHAALRPEQGVSAIRAAADAISNIPDGRIDHETVANVGVIAGGDVRNSVPAKVKIKAECRSLDHQKAADLAETIRSSFEKSAAAMGAVAQVNCELQHKSYALANTASVVKHAEQALQRNGITPDVGPSMAGNDAIFLNAGGIETVVIGFGGQGAHTVDECISVENMRKAIGSLLELLEILA